MGGLTPGECMRSRLVLSCALMACGPKPAATTAPFFLDADGIPRITAAPGDPLPVDPSVSWGVLDNGLTWYVEENARPAERAEIRLVVKAGSVLEDEDQRGLAHFVEHMAFNGSEHFEGPALVDYLQSIGMRFGAHVNAYTAFDETAYVLQVPTDDPALLSKGLLVLRDQAGGLTFDPEECERERGVVLEEWRLGQGLQQRVQDTLFPLTMHDSRYNDRLPIGTEESLKTFDCAAARRFWEDWYRPELMAVMAVGDFDAEAVQAEIAELFGSLDNPKPKRERDYFRVPDHDEPLAGVLVDAELPRASIMVMAKFDSIQENSHDAYRRFLLSGMVYTMINERLAAIAQDPDAPYFGAGMSETSVGHERSGRVLSIAPREGRELEALRVALTEVERARRWGFTPGELDRGRKESQRGMQAYWDERDTTDSATHIEELTRVFLTNEPMPGIPYEYGLSLVYLPEMDLEQASAWASANLFPDESRIVAALLPDREASAVSQAELVAVMREVAAADIPPPEAEGELPPLTTLSPEPGTVEPVGTDDVLGTVTWKLGNGATVVLKQTDFVADQILFRAISDGGFSNVEDEDFASAALMIPVARRSGLGELDAMDLGRVLAGHGTRVVPFVAENGEGFGGGGSAYELDTTLKLVHLAFTQPRFSPSAFRLEQESRIESVRNLGVDPDARFSKEAAELVWQDHPRMTPWTVEELESADLEVMKRLYGERFDISDFTFYLVGNIDFERAERLVAKWLASVPGSGKDDEVVDRGVRRRPGVHERTVDRGDTPRTRVSLTFHGPFESTWDNRSHLRVLEDALGDLMLEELRERLGGTYGVGVSAGVEERPEGTVFTVDIGFECDPDRADELQAATWAVLNHVKETPFSAERLASVAEQQRRERETAMRTNGFWLDVLSSADARG